MISKPMNEGSSNILNWLSSTILSCLICLTMSVYETFNFYFNSILKREGGCTIIRKLFLWCISSSRNGISNRISTIHP